MGHNPQIHLWVTNPVDKALIRIANYYVTNDQANFIPQDISPFVYNNNFYFRGSSQNEGIELWKLSDGNLGSENFQTKTITVFPNPTSGILNIQKESISACEVQIFDSIGKLMGTFKNQQQIDISNFNPGFYIMNIIDNEMNTVNNIKIIKQ